MGPGVVRKKEGVGGKRHGRRRRRRRWGILRNEGWMMGTTARGWSEARRTEMAGWMETEAGWRDVE